jgi:hypothetical protein
VHENPLVKILLGYQACEDHLSDPFYPVTASDGELPISPILGMVVGAALTLLSVVLLVVVKLRRSRSGRDQDCRQPHAEKFSGRNSTSLLHSAQGGKDLVSSGGGKDGVGDEKDPDIIPAKFGEFLFTTRESAYGMYMATKGKGKVVHVPFFFFFY